MQSVSKLIKHTQIIVVVLFKSFSFRKYLLSLRKFYEYAKSYVTECDLNMISLFHTCSCSNNNNLTRYAYLSLPHKEKGVHSTDDVHIRPKYGFNHIYYHKTMKKGHFSSLETTTNTYQVSFGIVCWICAKRWLLNTQTIFLEESFARNRSRMCENCCLF